MKKILDINILVHDYMSNSGWKVGFGQYDWHDLMQAAPSVFYGLEPVVNQVTVEFLQSSDVTPKTHERVVDPWGNEAWAKRDGKPLRKGWKVKPASVLPECPGQLKLCEVTT